MSLSKTDLESRIVHFRRRFPSEFDTLKYILEKWPDDVRLRAIEKGKVVVFILISPRRKLVMWSDQQGKVDLQVGAMKTREELQLLLNPKDLE